MKRLIRIATVTALAAMTTTHVWALGFKNPDQNAAATAQGEAFVAQADDPSAVYYNPAGLTQLAGAQVTGGGYLIFPDWKFSGTSGDAEMNSATYIPHLYAAHDFGLQRWGFGFGTYVPFGNAVDYGNNGPMRYTATESMLSVIAFSPAVAYQVNDHLSIGAAVNVYYGNTELNRLIPTALLLSTPGLPDGKLRFDGNGTAVGATIGTLWKINDKHSIGVVYRTPFSLNYDGDAEVRNDVTGLLGKSSAHAVIDFPQSVAVGYAFRPIKNLKLEADIEWTDWETLNDVKLRSSNPLFDASNNPLSTIPFSWMDSFFYEFGAQYEFAEHWIARAGYIYSENTVPSSTFSGQIPDANRHVFSAGFGYASQRLDVAVSYQYSLSQDRTVSGSPDNNFDGIGDADGEWETQAHAVIFTSTFRF